MSNERIEAITKALIDDKGQMKNLFEMSPEDAAAALAAKGYDFTTDELIEYGKLLDQAKKNAEGSAELDENALEDVAGGGLVVAALVGIAVGYWVYSKKW